MLSGSPLIRKKIFYISAAVIFAGIFFPAAAGEKKKPQALRSTEAASLPLVLPSTLDMQLLEAFAVMQKANAGESTAQHELGLRYLFGKGFPADTERAAYWIRKAADQDLPPAQFNLGILLMNGHGTEWDPFKAYRYFKKAAHREIPEANYVMGLLNTENFIIPRNWPAAYAFFKKASELGMEAGSNAMQEIRKRGYDTSFAADTKGKGDGNRENRTTQKARIDTGFSLLFIDFNRDTAVTVEDTTLIREALEYKDTADKSSGSNQKSDLDSVARSLFFGSAEAGSPEALCLMGRCYEHGLNVRTDPILACEYYLRAIRLDSYRAPSLMWKLINSRDFETELERRTAKKDPDALFVWAGLTSTGYSKLLDEKQAFESLQQAAAAGHLPSIVEVGSCYFTGRGVRQNRVKAAEFWDIAASKGSREAEIRLAAANALGQIKTQDRNKAFELLRHASGEGSLFSDLTLAYCFERGIGIRQDKGEAYRLFHKSMLRGSETAYYALRAMHDDMRPPEKEFQLQD
jgi:TPR repeat protein